MTPTAETIEGIVRNNEESLKRKELNTALDEDLYVTVTAAQSKLERLMGEGAHVVFKGCVLDVEAGYPGTSRFETTQTFHPSFWWKGGNNCDPQGYYTLCGTNFGRKSQIEFQGAEVNVKWIEGDQSCQKTYLATDLSYGREQIRFGVQRGKISINLKEQEYLWFGKKEEQDGMEEFKKFLKEMDIDFKEGMVVAFANAIGLKPESVLCEEFPRLHEQLNRIRRVN